MLLYPNHHVFVCVLFSSVCSKGGTYGGVEWVRFLGQVFILVGIISPDCVHTCASAAELHVVLVDSTLNPRFSLHRSAHHPFLMSGWPSRTSGGIAVRLSRVILLCLPMMGVVVVMVAAVAVPQWCVVWH